MKFQPLKGVTVVSVEQALSAPLASCRLADAGARVIKVERESGDFARDYDTSVKGESTYFAWVNRGKESVRINLKSKEGKELFSNLVESTDVLIQNLKPGAMKKLGFGSESLREKYPKLITCDISGYGEEGEYAEMKAYDNLVQAESGLIDVTGDGEMRAKVGISIADISTGMHAYSAILEALIQRGQSGAGVSIKVSMFDSLADWMMVPWFHQKYAGRTPKRKGVYHAEIAPYGPFKTADNRDVMIGIQNEREWERFCDGVLNSDIDHSDERFKNNSSRVKNVALLNELIQNQIGQLSHEKVVQLLKKHQIAFANLNTLQQFAEHPQLRLTEVEMNGELIKMADRPARFAGFESDFGAIPALGEHDEKIKKEFS
ncbi:CaiB/BaiF CoA-transferase family protein [Rhodohalobacter sp.]|uniref:CaiB/BaiF CoA transferase family protein n=1 Tax=Rhodohalobacter sp. TaxID=1974210 RepID=UPI002ACD5FC6|nr:CaiB/BaiF CoA-transferase family protein [Rhodohalobacter sp.]MDZ7755083.1 CaiB/BaiF CoA-transferase family protein [Rhodohalobacter sp.]